MPLPRTLSLPLTAGWLLLLSACNDLSGSGDPQSQARLTPSYSANIVTTKYGIPHISAENWGSLGYGTGYSFATENYCEMMGQFLIANGETARYFEEEGNLQRDFVWKMYNHDDRIQRMLQDLPQDTKELVQGYAAGFNRYLKDTGVDNLPQACQGAQWVRDVDSMDIMRAMHRLTLFVSGEPFAKFIAAANPPQTNTMAKLPSSSTDVQTPQFKSAMAKQIAQIAPQTIIDGIALPENHAVGSNAYAIGGNATQSGKGVLLSNPHLPWGAPLRYSMLHQTMGDELDVMGATPFGVPVVGVGFNKNLAWGITVSTSSRFSLYELQLNPENPMQYIYDGEPRDLEAFTVNAQQLQADGNVVTVERTFYLSHFGPVVDLGVVSPLLGGWPNAVGTLLVFRDANRENGRTLNQWLEMGQANTVAELKDATRALGQPFLNTFATDRAGDVFFGNVSVSANVSDAQQAACITSPVSQLLTASGMLTLNGADSSCEWGADEDAPEAGLFGWDSLPKQDTRDFVANANDSHWQVNPNNLLEGFPLSLGTERTQLSLRTRHTLDQAQQRIAGTDNLGEALFNVDNIRSLMYQADNYAAQLVVDDVVAICLSVDDWTQHSQQPALAATACEVLKDWDKTHKVDSVGAHIFWEFWQLTRDNPNLWALPFDVNDPLNTPRNLNVNNPSLVASVKEALASAATKLHQAGIALNAPWGEVQFVEKNGVKYGLHGGDESMMFSAILSKLVDGQGYSDIALGNSYIQAVTWDETPCPDAYAVLTYSQSTNPASDHFADNTELYSQSQWNDMPFCQADVEAAEIGRINISE